MSEYVWLERRVIAYAHQGGAWESPSSTRHAIAHAIDAGATGIELDVHATSDGELVVCHDASVDRTTDRTGSIASFTLAELREMDFSYWWIPGADVTPGRPADEYPFRGRAPADRAFGISTLREVLEAFPGVVLNLDIKQTAPVVAPYEEKLARLLAEYERVDDVIVASFLDPATDAFRGFVPRVPTSAGTMATADAWRAAHAGEPMPESPAVAYQVPERQGDLVVVDEQFVAAAHAAGKAVHVWTINDTESMERLLDLGVDGIISDLPTTLCGVLSARHVDWVR
ncbi:MAG TPA: glycerophosphodiester phosphodiesterase family protein [Acidimicrobiales bacterium]